MLMPFETSAIWHGKALVRVSISETPQKFDCAVGKVIREKFSGSIEAFSRRNPTSSRPRREHTKQRNFEEVARHKDVLVTGVTLAMLHMEIRRYFVYVRNLCHGL
ncbi:hypothetical protein RIF29_15084 [Crotalaria pallida]|uniref:Uncharacterized protein n=1 Tax=Crotalaria pallida TaxID=3830 RepID=A0AAN9IDB0_CROPI